MNKWHTKEEAKSLFKDSGNDLIEISLNYNSSKLLDPECSPYLTHYHNLLKGKRDKPLKILEIGVKDGDSLKIWKEYFHSDSKIYGIEINPEPLKDFKQDNTEIFYGSQTDIPFLNSITEKIGLVDLIIDDGGHTNNQLITTFNYLFEYGLKDNGLYVMEDLGTSYWYKWSGGLNNNGSIINFLKEKIDGINYRFWKGGREDFVPKPHKSLIDSTYQDENIQSITLMKGISFIRKGANNTGDE